MSNTFFPVAFHYHNKTLVIAVFQDDDDEICLMSERVVTRSLNFIVFEFNFFVLKDKFKWNTIIKETAQ